MHSSPTSSPFVLLNVAVDTMSVGAVVGSLLGLLPPLAAAAAVIWYAIQIYESKTVRAYLRVGRRKARAKRLAHKAAKAYTAGSI